MITTVKMSQRDFHLIYRQALGEAPNECCGMVGGLVHAGPTVEVTAVYPMTNADHSPDHFSLIPEEMFQVVKEMRKNKQKLLGNYHSHLAAPAWPSAEDIRLAYDPELVYFIISIAKPDWPQLRAFQIREEKVREIPIVFTND